MAASRTRSLDLANYADGITVLTARTLPDWANSLGIEIQFCTSAALDVWPNPLTTIRLAVEVSVDGGAWVRIFEGEQGGGIQLNKFGAEIPYMNFDQQLPAGLNRRIRGGMEITNGPCRTTMYISLNSESHVFLAQG